MAALMDSDLENAEMEGDVDLDLDLNDSEDLREIILNDSLPVCVSVVQGSFVNRKVQISKGDILILKSHDNENVTLSYRDPTDRSWNEIKFSINSTQQFIVLPPKGSCSSIVGGERAASIVSYPTIAELILDCPTYFEATSSYDDPYLPGMSVRAGDRFRFEKLVKDFKDGRERLKVRDELDNAIYLSTDCRANFCPLPDDRVFTLKELLDLATVPRRLKFFTTEKSGIKVNDIKISQEIEDEKDNLKNSTSLDLKTLPESSIASILTSNNDSGAIANAMSMSFTGVLHLLKPESCVLVSPHNDADTVWSIPITADLKVRRYVEDDYEVPSSKSETSQPPVHLPLSAIEQVPKFQAPSIPSMPQPLVPVGINSFVDLYSASFPAKAKLCNISQCNPFLRQILEEVDDVFVYRVEESRHLYLKNSNGEEIYSLSGDLNVNFVEYPEKFSRVSELLLLPVGSQVTVLEDIASDFPKPFFLRFGDIINISSTTPFSLKMKHASKNLEVLKCEKIDPEGGEPTKLKIPLDFEVNMVIVSDPEKRTMLKLQDLLNGYTQIPSQPVASVLPENEAKLLKSLPVSLCILQPIKEVVLVVKPAVPLVLPSSYTSLFKSMVRSNGEPPTGMCSYERNIPRNIGLPLHSGIVLAFRGRVDISDLDIVSSEADYIRTPIETLTQAQYDERVSMGKLNVDYEALEPGARDLIDRRGSESTLDRSSSTGMLAAKVKRRKMDKVRRLSRALNPKHWRQSKCEPEPLPHPSAMGLITLAARPNEAQDNDYQQELLRGGKQPTNTKDDSFNIEDDEEENVYEDVELTTSKAATYTSPTRSHATFSGPTYKSLPLPRLPPRGYRQRVQPRQAIDQSDGLTTGNSTPARDLMMTGEQSQESPTYDLPSSLAKENSLESSSGCKVLKKSKYDTPTNKKSTNLTDCQEASIEGESSSAETTNNISSIPPNARSLSSLYSTPAKNHSLTTSVEEKKLAVDKLPVAPKRFKRQKASAKVSEVGSDSNNISFSSENNDGQSNIQFPSQTFEQAQFQVKSDGVDSQHPIPKPKPRGIKKHVTSMPTDVQHIGGDECKTDSVIEGMDNLTLMSPEALLSRSPRAISKPKLPPKPKLNR